MRTYHVEINFQILLPRIRKDFAGWQHQPFVHEEPVACRPRLPWPSWPPWTSMQGITQSNLSLTAFSIKCVQTDKLGVCLFCLCLCTITNIYNYVPIVAGSHSMLSASFMISITAQTLRRRHAYSMPMRASKLLGDWNSAQITLSNLKVRAGHHRRTLSAPSLTSKFRFDGDCGS
jgi:hypothetical protein